MNALPDSWKQTIARIMRRPLMRKLMQLGILLTVPQQRIGVGVVVLDEIGRVLLLRHVFHPFAPWGVPGGWLHRHEDPADGALRELWEETRLTADLHSVIYLKHEKAPPHLGIVYLAYAASQPLQLSGEIMEACWCDPDQIPEEMFDFVREAIETAVHIHNKQQKQPYE
ncbi:MAG: NUDIX domain-containing protein [Anaerolineales bacterium]|nr:NUDIX domain-containing protein [Anaerolineales bacterium]